MLNIKTKIRYAGNSWVTGARQEHAKLPELKYYLLPKVWIQQHDNHLPAGYHDTEKSLSIIK